MPGLKKQLKHYIYQRGRVTFGELENLIRAGGYKVSQGERRLREIVKEGKIEPVRNNKGYVVGYIAKSQKTPETGKYGVPKGVEWRKELKKRREKEKIRKMSRDEKGRIIAC